MVGKAVTGLFLSANKYRDRPQENKEELREKIAKDTEHFLKFKQNKITVIPTGVTGDKLQLRLTARQKQRVNNSPDY